MMLMVKEEQRLIDKAKQYLCEVLGVTCKIEEDAPNIILPYYLKAGNLFLEGFVDTQKCMFMVTNECMSLTNGKGEKPVGSALVKRVEEIRNILGIPVIIVMGNVDSIRRRILISNRTGFVIPGKQVFLPFLGALLTERGMENVTTTTKKAFSPAAQVILLFHLQRESLEGKIISEIATRFPYSVKTISGAVKELEQAGVCTIEGDNRGKCLHLVSKEKIWNNASLWLKSPIQEVVYCDNLDKIPEKLCFVTYDKALSEYTFIADFAREAVAVCKNDVIVKKLAKSGVFNPVEGEYRVELWKYNPELLANGGVVDPLSLALCYKGTDDERVESELNNMIKRICEG